MKPFLLLILSLSIMTAVGSCRNQAAPLIGISCGRSETGSVRLSSAYTDAIVRAGGIPVVLPIIDDQALAERLLAKVDGVVFSGGPDIDPAEYGEEVWNGTVKIDAVRDRSDLLLARAALSSGKPVLAICRGEQLMNVVLGGTLYQDIPTQVDTFIKHSGFDHRIGVEKGSVLYQIFGQDSLSVNSSHHQAVKDPAPGIRISAYAPDGVVEAYEYEHVLSVQFHPERLVQKDSSWLALFRYFIGLASPRLGR